MICNTLQYRSNFSSHVNYMRIVLMVFSQEARKLRKNILMCIKTLYICFLHKYMHLVCHVIHPVSVFFSAN